MVDNTGHTQPHKPPSYSPPQPTTGLYPVFDVKEGAVEVTGLGRCVPSAPFAGQDQTHRGKIRQPTDEWQLQRLRDEFENRGQGSSGKDSRKGSLTDGAGAGQDRDRDGDERKQGLTAEDIFRLDHILTDALEGDFQGAKPKVKG